MTGAAIDKVQGWLEETWPSLSELVPAHVDRLRFKRTLIDQVRNNEELARCTPRSIFRACVKAANLGLEVGVMNSAFLVRYGDTCTLVPGYAGLIQLARNSGVKSVNVVTVRETDTVWQDVTGEITCKFDPFAEDRGAAKGWVCTVEFATGGRQTTVLTLAEYLKLRPHYWEKTPHKTHPEEMGKKACVRRAMKMVPLSPEVRDLVAEADAAEWQDVKVEVRTKAGNDALLELIDAEGEVATPSE